MRSPDISQLASDHLPSEELALLALAEPATETQQAHLAACRDCAAELAELTEVVNVARQCDPKELLAPPPDAVWDAIVAELGLADSEAEQQVSQGRLAAITPDPDAAQTRSAPNPDPQATTTETAPETNVIPLASRRRWMPVAAAAAVGALLGGSVVALATGMTQTQQNSVASASTQPDTITASAVLKPITDRATQGGTATVTDGPDGQVIRVDARGLPSGEGFYEVWLLDSQATKLVALGALPAGSVGTFTVPPGVSVADFPIVDISLEPYDGDPGHSHDSLLRGELET